MKDTVPGTKANPLICLKVMNISALSNASSFSSSGVGSSEFPLSELTLSELGEVSFVPVVEICPVVVLSSSDEPALSLDSPLSSDDVALSLDFPSSSVDSSEDSSSDSPFSSSDFPSSPALSL